MGLFQGNPKLCCVTLSSCNPMWPQLALTCLTGATKLSGTAVVLPSVAAKRVTWSPSARLGPLAGGHQTDPPIRLHTVDELVF